MRKKQEEREEGKEKGEAERDEKAFDIRKYKPKRIPQLMWRECIKKVWQVYPLVCLKCTGEMRVISYIYKRTVIKKVLTHLNFYDERKNQRAPPTVESEYTDPEIVSFDDGWSGYEEAAFEFLKNDTFFNGNVCPRTAEKGRYRQYFPLTTSSRKLAT